MRGLAWLRAQLGADGVGEWDLSALTPQSSLGPSSGEGVKATISPPDGRRAGKSGPRASVAVADVLLRRLGPEALGQLAGPRQMLVRFSGA